MRKALKQLLIQKQKLYEKYLKQKKTKSEKDIKNLKNKEYFLHKKFI